MPRFDVVLRDWEGDQTKGRVRHVDVPDSQWGKTPSLEDRLELIFMYGQNDMQQKPMRSVSVGDVIRLEGREYVVSSSGFGTEFSDEPAPILFFGGAFPRITEVDGESRTDLDEAIKRAVARYHRGLITKDEILNAVRASGLVSDRELDYVKKKIGQIPSYSEGRLDEETKRAVARYNRGLITKDEILEDVISVLPVENDRELFHVKKKIDQIIKEVD